MFTSASLLLSVGLLACTGEVSTEETDDGLDSAVDTGEVVDDGLWSPSAFNISASFAVDAETQSITTWDLTSSPTPVEPWVALLMWEDVDTAPDPDNVRSCEVVFFVPHDGSLLLESWSFTDATNDQAIKHVGFMVPEASLVATTECVGWDTDALGAPEAFLSKMPWGVGVGTLRDDVQEKVTTDYPDSDFAGLIEGDQLIGGSWSSTVWSPEIWASHVGFASPLEDGLLAVDEEGVPTSFLTQEQVLASPSALPGGFYAVRSIGAWDANAYLY